MMNLAMPSIVIKMMRQKFDQQWSVRKTHASQAEQSRMLRLLRQSSLNIEAMLEGQTLRVQDLLELKEGHLLMFDFPVERSVDLLVNRTHKFRGQMVSTGKKRACVIEKCYPIPGLPDAQPQGRISDGGGAAGAPAAES
jgi:flagellar motor switch protein FliM